jgi:anthranilate phosphoribosyltransferase
VLDTCGTGGDGLHTFNVSTAAALVVAACGVAVVKHGNRGVSSSSGSADVLAALGVPVDVGPEEVLSCLERTGLGFCFAPRFHPAMKHVAGVRKSLGFRTLFNLLGPLCNPARPAYQVLGVGRLELLDPMAQALAKLGTQNAYVVHAEDGLDEVSLGAITHARRASGGRTVATSWTPGDFGLSHVSVARLRVRDAAESAERIRQVLAGERGHWRDVVLANAAIGLLAAEKVQGIPEGVLAAQRAIDDGKAREVLRQLTLAQP